MLQCGGILPCVSGTGRVTVGGNTYDMVGILAVSLAKPFYGFLLEYPGGLRV